MPRNAYSMILHDHDTGRIYVEPLGPMDSLDSAQKRADSRGQLTRVKLLDVCLSDDADALVRHFRKRIRVTRVTKYGLDRSTISDKEY